LPLRPSYKSETAFVSGQRWHMANNVFIVGYMIFRFNIGEGSVEKKRRKKPTVGAKALNSTLM